MKQVKINEIAGIETFRNASKGNPYHDALGRFTSGPSTAFGKYNVESDKKGQQFTAYADSLRTDFGSRQPGTEQSDEFYSRLEPKKYEALARTGSVLAHINDDVSYPLSKENQTQQAQIDHVVSEVSGIMERARYIEGRGGSTEENRQLSRQLARALDEQKRNLTSLSKSKGFGEKARAVQAACATLSYLVQEMADSPVAYRLKYSDYYGE